MVLGGGKETGVHYLFNGICLKVIDKHWQRNTLVGDTMITMRATKPIGVAPPTTELHECVILEHVSVVTLRFVRSGC